MDINTKMLIISIVNIVILMGLTSLVSWIYKKKTGISQKQTNFLYVLFILFYVFGLIGMYVINLLVFQ